MLNRKVILALTLILSVWSCQPCKCSFGPNLIGIFEQLMNPSIFAESTASLVEKAGYVPEVYNLPTQPGYVINLVRVVNPLISRKKILEKRLLKPILLVHGLIESANTWLVMGYLHGKPQDWPRFDANKLSQKHLRHLIGSDRTSRSLAFLLSNFGFDVWLMNRRNTQWSRQVSPKFQQQFVDFFFNSNDNKDHLKNLNWNEDLPLQRSKRFAKSSSGGLFDNSIFSTSITKLFKDSQKKFMDTLGYYIFGHFLEEKITQLTNKSYYDFSFDEQANIDLPMVLDFIMETTGEEGVSVIGHSAGGMMALMLLANQPEYNSKINHAALIAPAVNLHYESTKTPIVRMLSSFEYLFGTTLGSINALPFLPLGLLVGLPSCIKDQLRGYPCYFVDSFFGLGVDRWDLSVALATLRLYIDEAGFHEMAHLAQSGQRSQMHFYDYHDPKRNAIVYGDLEIPKYRFDKISLSSMSLWQANTDRLVNQFDTQLLRKLLKNPYDYHFIGNAKEKLYFNHLSFQLDKNVTTLFNTPLLKRLAKANADSDETHK